eukprot:2826339-Prymnesium_polylepis.2
MSSCVPLAWPQRGTQRKEDDADDKRYQNASLLGIVRNEQNPSGCHAAWDATPVNRMRVQRPQFESLRRYSTPACGTSRAAPTKRHGVQSRPTGRPWLDSARSIEQGDPDRPHGDKQERRRAGGLILVGVAIERQVGGEVASRLTTADTLHAANKSLADVLRCEAVALNSAFEKQLPDNEASCEEKNEEEGPGRAQQHALPVLTQARTRHIDALELGWELEQVDPSRVFLQTHRRNHIEDARHRRDALIEAHQQLDLVAHARRPPHSPGTVEPLELRIAPASVLEDVDCRAEACTSKQHEKHGAHHDNAAGSDMVAVVAARTELVKVSGVGGPIAQLAPRAVIAIRAVAVAVKTGVDAATARSPAPV